MTALCKCGTPLGEICFIPGTEACFACHELRLMEETGFGVALTDGKGQPYLKVLPEDFDLNSEADTKDWNRGAFALMEIPF